MAGLSREVEEDVAAGAASLFDEGQLVGQAAVELGVADIAVDVEHALSKGVPELGVEWAVFEEPLDAVAHF